MTTPFSVMLDVRELACERGGRRLFEDLSFCLKPGEALLVRGPNGVGKSSLMRQIAGLLPLAAGSVVVDGPEQGTPASEVSHYVGHLNAVKASLSVYENLSFWSRYLGGGDVEAALAFFGLAAIADVPAAYLSAGQKRKLALSRLFACPRPIWILDEPSVSLDVASVERLGQAVKTHGQAGGIAIVSTHVPLGLDFTFTLELEAHMSDGEHAT